MIVSRPVISEEGEEICVSSRVRVRDPRNEFPDSLWFRFPKSFGDYVTDRTDGFAVTLLPLAMTLGEELHIQGALSPRLLRGMEDYQRVQTAWKPTPFRPIEITFEDLESADPSAVGSGVGCAFSGGVDSFYTLWSHLPQDERNRKYRLTHCIMINGFDKDSDLEGSGHFASLQRVYEPMMERLGVQMIVARTNFMQFSDAARLKMSFAAMVATPALVLGRLFSTFFIASSFRFDDFLREGPHLLFDHLIATETLETIHDAPELTRLEKTGEIAKWNETYSSLRVCHNRTRFQAKTGTIQNCCRCEKCIRTMASLDLFGVLDRYPVFPRRPTHFGIWRCMYRYKGSQLFARQIINHAKKVGRPGVAFDFSVAVLTSRLWKLPAAAIKRTHRYLSMRSKTYSRLARRAFPSPKEMPGTIGRQT